MQILQNISHATHTRFKRGFTLVETLVAVSVLMLAIIGPMTIASESMQNAFIARDQIVAFYLAQEGIEAVRYRRDNNALIGAPDWMSGMASCVNANCGIRIENLPTATFTACSSLSGCRIYLNASTNGRAMYSHNSSGTATPFTRTIQIRSVASTLNSVAREVVVTVSWQTPIMARQVTVRTVLYNQYDTLYTTP